MFAKRRSKSAGSWDIPPIECHECNHKIFTEKFGYHRKLCECKECVSIRKQQKLEAEKEKREKIHEKYSIEDREPIDYAELGFFHKLVLLTLFRMQTDEDFEYILSLDAPSRIGPYRLQTKWT